MDPTRINESKDFPIDREIQKTNAFQKEHNLPPIFFNPPWSIAQLKEYRSLLRYNGELKVKPAFTSKDTILIHFNRVLPGEKPDDNKLKSKYADHIATHKFGAKYAARHFIDLVISNASSAVPTPSKTWKGPNRLYLNDWILISTDELSSETLEDIMGDTLSKEEQKWKVPHPYDQYAAYIGFYNQGVHPQINERALTARGERYTPGVCDDGKKNYEPQRRAPKPEKEVQQSIARKEKKQRDATPKSKTPDGLTSIGQIAASLKIGGSEARKILRTSKTPKPDHGWSWSKDEVEKITAILKKGMKK